MDWLNAIVEYGVELIVIVGEAYALLKLFEKYNEVRDKSDERIDDMITQVGALTDAVNNNTLAVARIVDKSGDNNE